MSRAKLSKEDLAYSARVGNVIRERRLEQGHTLTEFAAELGISRACWSRMETGKAMLTVSRLRMAARLLECEPWQIVRQVEEEKGSD